MSKEYNKKFQTALGVEQPSKKIDSKNTSLNASQIENEDHLLKENFRLS